MIKLVDAIAIIQKYKRTSEMLKSSRRRWANTFPAFDPLQDWLIREDEGRTHHSLFPEVNADCGDELGVELVVCISVQEGGLPHAGVPQGKELYKVVIIPISHSDGHEEHLQENREKHVE